VFCAPSAGSGFACTDLRATATAAGTMANQYSVFAKATCEGAYSSPAATASHSTFQGPPAVSTPLLGSWDYKFHCEASSSSSQGGFGDGTATCSEGGK
jgi:hypothetical protein